MKASLVSVLVVCLGLSANLFAAQTRATVGATEYKGLIVSNLHLSGEYKKIKVTLMENIVLGPDGGIVPGPGGYYQPCQKNSNNLHPCPRANELTFELDATDAMDLVFYSSFLNAHESRNKINLSVSKSGELLSVELAAVGGAGGCGVLPPGCVCRKVYEHTSSGQIVKYVTECHQPSPIPHP